MKKLINLSLLCLAAHLFAAALFSQSQPPTKPAVQSSYIPGVRAVAVSYDGSKIATAGDDSTIRVWDVSGGGRVLTLQGHIRAVNSLAFSDNGLYLVSGSDDHNVVLWHAMTGSKIRTLSGHADPVTFVSFTKYGTDIISESSIENRFKINLKRWDFRTGQETKSLREDEPGYYAEKSPVAFGPDRASNAKMMSRDLRFLVEAVDRGKVNVSSFRSNKVLFSLIGMGYGDGAAVTPDGLFDATPSARRMVYFRVGNENITLEQMKEIYYVPGLMRKIYRNEPLPQIELFSEKDLHPEVVFTAPAAGQKRLTVKLINRGGGIGQVQILVNGKEFVRDARPEGFDANAKEVTLEIDLTNAPLIDGATNKIEVVARNAAGSLSTRGTERGTETIKLSGGQANRETPNIYAIVVGISQYTGENLSLNFAAKDAEDFAEALEIGALKLLGDRSKVHIRLLTGGGSAANVRFASPDAKISKASKPDIERAFADFKTAQPSDVFIVYFAGHGVSLNLSRNQQQNGGGDTYLYLTQEATTTDKNILSVESSRRAMTVSSEELQDLMKQNKALKQVLILDTCAAGQLAPSLIGRRDLPADQIRAIERLKDNTGFYVLMGAAADAVSYEASQYGQGLLTYSLLQAMKGAQLRENQFADVNLLFNYAQETVPKMAKNIGGIQQPLIITPATSTSFDIGKFTTEEQKQISLAAPKPIILRPNLRNTALRFDNLKLSQIMTEQLRRASYVESRGEPTQIVFVEADEMTDAVLPVGDYTIEGETLKISVILVKNNASVGKEIVVTGRRDEPEKVTRQLIETIMQSLK